MLVKGQLVLFTGLHFGYMLAHVYPMFAQNMNLNAAGISYNDSAQLV